MGSDFGSRKTDLTELNLFFPVNSVSCCQYELRQDTKNLCLRLRNWQRLGLWLCLCYVRILTKAKCHSRGWLRFCFGFGEDSRVETGASVAFWNDHGPHCPVSSSIVFHLGDVANPFSLSAWQFVILISCMHALFSFYSWTVEETTINWNRRRDV